MFGMVQGGIHIMPETPYEENNLVYWAGIAEMRSSLFLRRFYRLALGVLLYSAQKSAVNGFEH